MIRKTFNKIAGKTFVSRTKAHILSPKAINLHFPNAINQEFKFLNLDNLLSVSFDIKEDLELNQFILSSQILTSSSNGVQYIEVAKFKTKEEAETALNDIRVALYAPTKSFTKWVFVLSVISGLICMASIHTKELPLFNKLETATVEQVPNTVVPATMPVGLPMIANPGMNPSEIPPPVSEGEIDKMIQQLQEVKQLQSGMIQPNVQQQPMVGQPQEQLQQPQEQLQQQPQEEMNPAEQFLNGLN